MKNTSGQDVELSLGAGDTRPTRAAEGMAGSSRCVKPWGLCHLIFGRDVMVKEDDGFDHRFLDSIFPAARAQRVSGQGGPGFTSAHASCGTRAGGMGGTDFGARQSSSTP